MALTIGTQLGSHEIIALLGKGGMGEVYRARDLKLKREVAIKILPEEFSHDSDRVSRFQREAEVLASLNHPNIAAIHDVAEANGSRYLVLELVEGETLADRIERGPIPLEEALNIAKQIAEALEAAHEQGIVHRDLKPANVKITSDGKVKVLDFGLARVPDRNAAGTALSNSPTLSLAATNAGMIMGTAAYMSPEQARGKPVDKRADIWAFGVVLYEMLTGKRLFDGEDLTDTLARVVRDKPESSQVPAKVRRLLDRCLEKDPKLRLRDISVALGVDRSGAGTHHAGVHSGARAMELVGVGCCGHCYRDSGCRRVFIAAYAKTGIAFGEVSNRSSPRCTLHLCVCRNSDFTGWPIHRHCSYWTRKEYGTLASATELSRRPAPAGNRRGQLALLVSG